jgi:excisionase family DNA binding protein
VTAKPAFFSFGIVSWLVIHRLGVCVPSGIVSGLMGLAISVREKSVEVPRVATGAAAKRRRVACSPSPHDCDRKGLGHMSTANSEARHPREAEGSARHSYQLDELKLPLVFTVEEAADWLGVGRTVMYALVSSGAVESVRIGRLRRVPADALVTFLDELRRGPA